MHTSPLYVHHTPLTTIWLNVILVPSQVISSHSIIPSHLISSHLTLSRHAKMTVSRPNLVKIDRLASKYCNRWNHVKHYRDQICQKPYCSSRHDKLRDSKFTQKFNSSRILSTMGQEMLAKVCISKTTGKLRTHMKAELSLQCNEYWEKESFLHYSWFWFSNK